MTTRRAGCVESLCRRTHEPDSSSNHRPEGSSTLQPHGPVEIPRTVVHPTGGVVRSGASAHAARERSSPMTNVSVTQPATSAAAHAPSARASGNEDDARARRTREGCAMGRDRLTLSSARSVERRAIFS